MNIKTTLPSRRRRANGYALMLTLLFLAITLIGSFLVMLSNLLVDVLYPLLDPRATDTRTAK